MKKIFCIIILLSVISLSIFADGNESVYDSVSPAFLGGGWSTVSNLGPQADSINPAASARTQRITLDLSYIGYGFDSTTAGWKGLIINAGASIPSRVGVFSVSGHFRNSPLWETMQLGTQAELNGSFSKEIYEDFLTGAGLNFSIGETAAITMDLGMIHMLGDWLIFPDFRWGVALQEFGWVEKTVDYPSAFTLSTGAGATYTLGKNFKIDAVADLTFPSFQNVRFSLGGDFSFKNLFGLRFSSEADLRELVDGDLSALIPSFGLYYNYTTSFSEDKLSSGKAEQGWDRSSIGISASAAPMGNGLWGIGGGLNVPMGVIDNKAPEIELDVSGFRFMPISSDNTEGDESDSSSSVEDEESVENSDETSAAVSTNVKSTKGFEQTAFVKNSVKSAGTTRVSASFADKNQKSTKYFVEIQNSSSEEKGLVKDPSEAEAIRVVEYISPNNDGKYDDLDFPISIKDSRYIQGFALVIQNMDGNIIRKIGNKEERPENAGFIGFFKRLFYVEKGINIPSSLRWDGTTNEGSVVSDGKYIFYLQAWDDNDNQGFSEPYGIVVDNTAPSVVLNPPDAYNLIFSPDGDGNKDTLSIGIEGSVEDLWTFEIRNSSGNLVKTYSWHNEAPVDIVWDGKSGKGEVMADDVYYCSIFSTDKAGNSFQTGFENIIINTIPTPISLSVSNSYFSPGNIDAIENIEFGLNIPVRDGILDWTLAIKDQSRVVKTFIGKSDPPKDLLYRGETDAGNFLPEGTYHAELSINYINGNKPFAVSPDFHVDVTRPDVDVNISYTVFSPNGDDNKDTIKIYQETSREDEWTGTILDEEENTVASFSWIDTPDAVLEWDGYYGAGERAPDGDYYYRLSSMDRAGNLGQSRLLRFNLDTEETPILLSAGFDAFSPNADSIKDKLSLKPELRITDGISSWELRILDDEDSVVRTYLGSGIPDDEIFWDGFSNDGRKAEDGEYHAEFEVVYTKGDVSLAGSRRFILDTTYPELEYESSLSLFSPDGDGELDEVLIEQNTSIEALWIGTISDSENKVVREYFWKDSASNFRWDGKDGEGNILPDGEYSYVLVSEDKAGNRSEGAPISFQMDASTRVCYVTAEGDGFSPNQNGHFEDFQFNVIIPNKEGISEWKLQILDASGTVVKTYAEEIIPDRIVWDGFSDRNRRVPDGSYSGKLMVKYVKGNNPESATTPFIIDTGKPELDLTVLPLPFSPDNDGIDDDLNLLPQIRDMSDIKMWMLVISDRTGRSFKSYSGSDSLASEIIWDGKGDNGELVTSAEDYFYSFSAVDRWNNRSEKKGTIPVDVLVVRIGDILKIQIASIQFAPDSPELSEDSQEIIDRNISVLRRLSEILKKYERYKITIEGHAALLRWNNPTAAAKEETEELQPLSQARAETVKNYLVQLGISANRINTLGRGGTQPVVPHSDTDNRWKNRRVEFILEK